jgi:FOG: Ankyrin repeat
MDIIEASREGRRDTVRKFLDKGADVNTRNHLNSTGLMLASENGRENIVRLLLDRGADVNAINDFQDSALMGAIRKNRENVVKILLDRGADVDMPLYASMTPLMQAAIEGRPHIARLLLENGAKINMKDENGNTALELAERHGHKTTYKLIQSYTSLPERVVEICDSLNKNSRVEELRKIVIYNVKQSNFLRVKKCFEYVGELAGFRDYVKTLPKQKLCAYLAKYYKECKNIISNLEKDKDIKKAS